MFDVYYGQTEGFDFVATGTPENALQGSNDGWSSHEPESTYTITLVDPRPTELQIMFTVTGASRITITFSGDSPPAPLDVSNIFIVTL